jgi:hypothetical protein
MAAMLRLVLLTALVLAGASSARAQEPGSPAPAGLAGPLAADTASAPDTAAAVRGVPVAEAHAVQSLYDPAEDIIPPGAARWLYLGTLLYEAPLWSAALNGCLGFYTMENAKRATAVQLLATPASFFGFLWATRRREITLGMLNASARGTMHGFGAGLVAGNVLFDWGDRDIGKFFPELGTAVAGSVAGHIVGLRYAEREQLNYGNVQLLGEAGLWGGGYAAYLAALPIPWGGSDLFGAEQRPRLKLVEVAGLAGWGAGLYCWHRLGPRDFTTGDAVSFGCSEAMGALTAAAAWSLVPGSVTDGEWGAKLASLLPAAVNAGGLWYSYRFHRQRDVSFAQSLLVSLGTGLGAGSIGGAVALLLTPESGDDNGKIALWSTAAGGWLGFHLTHALLETDSPGRGRFSSTREPAQFAFAPANALGLLIAAKTGTSCRIPLLSAEF